MISAKTQRIKYVLGDLVSVSLGWLAFNVFRYGYSPLALRVAGFPTLKDYLCSPTLVMAQFFVPVCCVLIFVLSGYYNRVFLKSRIQELSTTFYSMWVCILAIFFVFLVNDAIEDRMASYEMFMVLALSLFLPCYIVRLCVTTHANRLVHSGKWGFNTLLIGPKRATDILKKKIEAQRISNGYRIVVCVNGHSSLNLLRKVCKEKDIRYIIIANGGDTVDAEPRLYDLLLRLYPLDLPILATVDTKGLLMNRALLSNISGVPLMDMTTFSLGDYEQNIKRLTDIVLSVLALIVASPLMLVVALLIKRDSKGGVIYSQIRMGRHGREFRIYKFRTMCLTAEADGVPHLSCNNDSRVTRIGHFLRKYRIDELPQFYNVLKGDMSIVGPRPERPYYVQQLQAIAPYYAILHCVRPGLTSLGMVKFGYASSLEQMIRRLDFDILYVKNMSLLNDLKIIIYTVRTVLTGKGV